ncbi:MAG TPA: DUF3034 domain-containing protein [Pseudohongiella sp.]|nr:hypothetical protein [Pseudohongiella sp.]HBX38895.1 DUF3034 domain-containing protein [Pseudohongiella sp.]
MPLLSIERKCRPGRFESAGSWLTVTLLMIISAGLAMTASAQSLETAGRQGKIKGTAAVSSISGASGGGLTPWATLGTYASDGQKGVNIFQSRAAVDDYSLDVVGGAFNYDDRVEIAYAKHDFEIEAAGLHIRQDKISARYKLHGDIIYGSAPQITIGIEHGRLRDKAVARSVGAEHTAGTDFIISAGKVWLDGIANRSTLLNVNVRYGESNQFGILGYGGDANSTKFTTEVAAAIFLTRSIAIGGEFRQKGDYLSALNEDHARDLFIAWFPNKHLSVTGAWIDLGDIAGAADQRGYYISVQATL